MFLLNSFDSEFSERDGKIVHCSLTSVVECEQLSTAQGVRPTLWIADKRKYEVISKYVE